MKKSTDRKSESKNNERKSKQQKQRINRRVMSNDTHTKKKKE